MQHCLNWSNIVTELPGVIIAAACLGVIVGIAIGLMLFRKEVKREIKL